jgi:hypothetical protein
MKKLGLFALIAVVMGVWACTTVVVKEDTGPEVLLPAGFIESPDANTVSLRCQGMGKNMEAAVLQARKACVEWLVNDQIAQTAEEKQGYKAVQQQIFAQLDKYVGMPPPGAADGKGRGIKSRVKIGEKIKVEIIETVQKKTLVDDLTALGVTKSKSDMLASVGMPTMLVQPSKASKGSQYRKLIEDLVNSYLTKNKLEVVDATNVENLNKLTDAIGEAGGGEEDEIAKLAQAIGADVYVVFEAKVDKQPNGSVAYGAGLSAFETTTSRKLGSELVIGPARANWVAGEEMKAFVEPVSDAMGKLLPQIFDYWKEDSPKGNRFLITIKNAPKSTDTKISSLLKKSCAFVKTNSSGKTVKFYAQCKGDNMEIAGALEEGLNSNFAGSNFEFLAKSGSTLIVLFK